MLIVGDENKHPGGIPWVTWSLIAINVGVFLMQLVAGDALTTGFALIPEEITTGKDLVKTERTKVREAYYDTSPTPDYGKTRYHDVWVSVPQAPGPFPIQLTMFTSMFLHGGWLHLIGNMWFLFVFGRNVELAMRHGLFLAFYVICGTIAALADVVVDPHSVIPCVGASGAISAVLGAYFFIYPLNKVKLWFGWLAGIYVGVIEVPAVLVLGFWVVAQYLSTCFAITNGTIQTGTAYWSHLGGFVSGIVFIICILAYLRRKQAEVDAVAQDEAQIEALPMSLQPQEALKADPFDSFLPK